MQGGVVPVDELTVVPDFVRLLKRHADSLFIEIRSIEIRAEGRRFLARSRKFDSTRIINAKPRLNPIEITN
jgi:hypothetical protein